MFKKHILFYLNFVLIIMFLQYLKVYNFISFIVGYILGLIVYRWLINNDEEQMKYVVNLISQNIEKDKEIERLTVESTEWESKCYKYQDIINELEKVLNEEVKLRYHGKDNAKENKIFNAGGMLYRDYIMDTLKELKEGKI